MYAKERVLKLIKYLSSYEKLSNFKITNSQLFEKDDKSKKGEPKLEGISFRFKTVQFHLVDNTFQEIKKLSDFFGDVKIYAERFSLPEWGEKKEGLDGNEYQFEITALIESKTSKETYYNELEKIMNTISDKHDVDIIITPTEEFYNINHIIFYTKKEGVFSKE